MKPRARDRIVAAAFALIVRLAVVAWGASRFPPAADGAFYHRIAARLAEGGGYTWVWPDGAVTYAAHYPIGYPAILALFYRAFGASGGVAMLVNTLFGVASVVAAYELARASGWGTRAARVSAFVVAIHPALVPYTLAVMTEGPTGALLLVAAAFAAHARTTTSGKWVWLCGLALGVATLVRPQSIVLAPVFGWLGSRGSVVLRLRRVVVTSVLAVLCCLPWTVRNCVRMHRCALVSVNAGWNLLIGEATTNGAWQPIEVPDECKTVWDEAGKDSCFEAAAERNIGKNWLDFIEKMPKKVSVTFDYFGGAPWYLHESNASAFGDGAKVALGAVETIFSRLVLAVALFGVALLTVRSSRLSAVVALVGVVFAFVRWGSVGYVALALSILLPKRARSNVALASCAWTILSLVVTHAVFFGAGRYGLVASPFISVVCASVGVRSFRGKPIPSLVRESFRSSFKRS